MNSSSKPIFPSTPDASPVPDLGLGYAPSSDTPHHATVQACADYVYTELKRDHVTTAELSRFLEDLAHRIWALHREASGATMRPPPTPAPTPIPTAAQALSSTITLPVKPTTPSKTIGAPEPDPRPFGHESVFDTKLPGTYQALVQSIEVDRATRESSADTQMAATSPRLYSPLNATHNSPLRDRSASQQLILSPGTGALGVEESQDVVTDPVEATIQRPSAAGPLPDGGNDANAMITNAAEISNTREENYGSLLTMDPLHSPTHAERSATFAQFNGDDSLRPYNDEPESDVTSMQGSESYAHSKEVPSPSNHTSSDQITNHQHDDVANPGDSENSGIPRAGSLHDKPSTRRDAGGRHKLPDAPVKGHKRRKDEDDNLEDRRPPPKKPRQGGSTSAEFGSRSVTAASSSHKAHGGARAKVARVPNVDNAAAVRPTELRAKTPIMPPSRTHLTRTKSTRGATAASASSAVASVRPGGLVLVAQSSREGSGDLERDHLDFQFPQSQVFSAWAAVWKAGYPLKFNQIFQGQRRWHDTRHHLFELSDVWNMAWDNEPARNENEPPTTKEVVKRQAPQVQELWDNFVADSAYFMFKDVDEGAPTILEILDCLWDAIEVRNGDELVPLAWEDQQLGSSYVVALRQILYPERELAFVEVPFCRYSKPLVQDLSAVQCRQLRLLYSYATTPREGEVSTPGFEMTELSEHIVSRAEKEFWPQLITQWRLLVKAKLASNSTISMRVNELFPAVFEPWDGTVTPWDGASSEAGRHRSPEDVAKSLVALYRSFREVPVQLYISNMPVAKTMDLQGALRAITAITKWLTNATTQTSEVVGFCTYAGSPHISRVKLMLHIEKARAAATETSDMCAIQLLDCVADTMRHDALNLQKGEKGAREHAFFDKLLMLLKLDRLDRKYRAGASQRRQPNAWFGLVIGDEKVVAEMNKAQIVRTLVDKFGPGVLLTMPEETFKSFEYVFGRGRNIGVWLDVVAKEMPWLLAWSCMVQDRIMVPLLISEWLDVGKEATEMRKSLITHNDERKPVRDYWNCTGMCSTQYWIQRASATLKRRLVDHRETWPIWTEILLPWQMNSLCGALGKTSVDVEQLRTASGQSGGLVDVYDHSVLMLHRRGDGDPSDSVKETCIRDVTSLSEQSPGFREWFAKEDMDEASYMADVAYTNSSNRNVGSEGEGDFWEVQAAPGGHSAPQMLTPWSATGYSREEARE